MKKGIFVAAVALVLAMSLPMLAFADSSPRPTSKSAGTAGNMLTVSGTEDDIAKLIVEPCSTPTNIPQTVYNFTVYMSDHTNITSPVTLTFDVGKVNAGRAYTLYCVHGENSTAASEQLSTGTVSSDGTLTYTTNSLSYYSVVLSGDSKGGNTDSSSKSPSTGANLGGVGAFAAGAVILAAGALFVLRRRDAE